MKPGHSPLPFHSSSSQADFNGCKYDDGEQDQNDYKNDYNDDGNR